MRKLTFALALVLALTMTATATGGEPVSKAGIGGGDGFLAPLGMTGTYTDAEINEITNVVNGEVGGIGGASVTLTYADGSQLYTDGYTLRRIHARIVDNQVRSGLFPDSVDGCVRQCWSPDYASTGWRDSAQWQSCREEVLAAVVSGHYGIPDNVFAATCDPAFCQWYPGWYLWARVDWDTGWVSGTFYYYAYG